MAALLREASTPVVGRSRAAKADLRSATAANGAGSTTAESGNATSQLERAGLRALFYAVCTIGSAMQNQMQKSAQYYSLAKQSIPAVFTSPSPHAVSAFQLMSVMATAIDGDPQAGAMLTMNAHAMLSFLPDCPPTICIGVSIAMVNLISKRLHSAGPSHPMKIMKAGPKALEEAVFGKPVPLEEDSADPASRFVHAFCYLARQGRLLTPTPLQTLADIASGTPVDEAFQLSMLDEIITASAERGFMANVPWSIVRDQVKVFLALAAGKAVADVPRIRALYDEMSKQDSCKRSFISCLQAARVMLMLRALRDQHAAASANAGASSSSGSSVRVEEALSILPHIARFLIEAMRSGGCPLPADWVLLRKLRESTDAEAGGSSAAAGDHDGSAGSSSNGTGGTGTMDLMTALFLVGEAMRRRMLATKPMPIPAHACKRRAASYGGVPAAAGSSSTSSSTSGQNPQHPITCPGDRVCDAIELMLRSNLMQSKDTAVVNVATLMAAIQESYRVLAASPSPTASATSSGAASRSTSNAAPAPAAPSSATGARPAAPVHAAAPTVGPPHQSIIQPHAALPDGPIIGTMRLAVHPYIVGGPGARLAAQAAAGMVTEGPQFGPAGYPSALSSSGAAIHPSSSGMFQHAQVQAYVVGSSWPPPASMNHVHMPMSHAHAGSSTSISSMARGFGGMPFTGMTVGGPPALSGVAGGVARNGAASPLSASLGIGLSHVQQQSASMARGVGLAPPSGSSSGQLPRLSSIGINGLDEFDFSIPGLDLDFNMGLDLGVSDRNGSTGSGSTLIGSGGAGSMSSMPILDFDW